MLAGGRRDVRTAQRLAGGTHCRRICPGLLGSLPVLKIPSFKRMGHGPGERGTFEWVAPPSDPGEPLSLARACLVG